MPVGKILFPPFTIDSVDLGLLAAGSGAFIIALTVAQALLALKGHARAALAWLAGVLTFVLGAAVIPGLEKRVEIGFLAGSIVAVLVMMLSLYQRMQRGVPENIDSLIDQIEHEPLEF